MYEMQTTATNVSVCQSVCLSVTRLYCAETAEWIEVLFGKDSLGLKERCVRLYNTTFLGPQT